MSVLKDKNEKQNALIVAHWFSEELYTNQTYQENTAIEFRFVVCNLPQIDQSFEC